MNFDLVSHIKDCYVVLQDTSMLSFVYYSHIPTSIIALVIGIFVYLKDKKLLVNKILLFISFLFSLWVIVDLITWIKPYNSVITMFAWSFFGILNSLICVFSIYFVYVYISGRDVSLNKKLIFGLLLLPVILFTPTMYNVTNFSIYNCGATENEKFTNYYNALGLLAFIVILFLVISGYKKAEKNFKKQVLLMGVGIEFFLLSFFITGFLASYLYGRGVISDFKIEQYGLFGMTFFMGMLAFMIVKFKAFNIKLLGAQALVVGIIILIASQFAFIQNPTNRILTGITLAIVTIFGWWLIRSVKTEVKQREDLEVANKKIEADKKVVEKANKKLIELDQQKNEFINIASHQLRTPITVIRGVVSMMKDGTIDKFDKKTREQFYDGAWFKCEKLEDIINDILNATSLVNQKFSAMDKDAEELDLPEMIEKIIKDFEPETKEREISLKYVPGKSQLPKIIGQRRYLDEVFINLITNAIKYTPSRTKTPDIRETRDQEANIRVSAEKKGDNVVVTVEDNGIGIPKEAMPKLFQKFARAENAKNMYTDGTGLGLFIIKGIVEGHGGKVWVTSEEGKGSKFFVRLPINAGKKIDIKKYIKEKAVK